MKIRNKYSKQRYTFLEKLQIEFSSTIIKLCYHFPKSELTQNLLHEISLEDRSVNERDNTKFVSMFMIDLIQKEDFFDAKSGVKKLLNKYRPYSYLTFNDIKNAEEFFSADSDDYYGSRWYNLGYIEFEKDSFIRKYVSMVQITALSFSPSLVCLSVNIIPTEFLIEEFSNILNADLRERKILSWPNFKICRTIIKHKIWGFSSRSVNKDKEELIRDLMLEIKYNVMKRISSYLPIYFFREKIVSPSLEVYNVYSNNNCEGTCSPLGINSYRGDISHNGEIGFFYTCKSDDIDYESKLITNIDSFPSMYHDETQYLNSIAGSLVKDIYYGLVINSLLDYFNKQLLKLRNKTFKILSKKYSSYYKQMKHKFQIENTFKMLSRVINEVDREKVEWHIRNYRKEFAPISRRNDHTSYESYVKKNMSELELVNKNMIDTKNMLDEYINMNSMRSNYRIGKANLMLTIITVLASVTGAIIGLFALIIALDPGKSNEMAMKIDNISNFLQNLFR